MKKFIVLILMANLAFAGKYFYEKKSSQSQNTLIKPLPEIKKEDFSMLKNRDEIAQQYKFNKSFWIFRNLSLIFRNFYHKFFKFY